MIKKHLTNLTISGERERERERISIQRKEEAI